MRVFGDPNCRRGTSNILQDYGVDTSLEDCQRNCLNLNGCTDISWRSSDKYCVALDGCENPGPNLSWYHYVLKGNNTYLIKDVIKI